MSSPLTLIVLGQAYFFGALPNATTLGEANGISVPSIDQSLLQNGLTRSDYTDTLRNNPTGDIGQEVTGWVREALRNKIADLGSGTESGFDDQPLAMYVKKVRDQIHDSIRNSVLAQSGLIDSATTTGLYTPSKEQVEEPRQEVQSTTEDNRSTTEDYGWNSVTTEDTTHPSTPVEFEDHESTTEGLSTSENYGSATYRDSGTTEDVMSTSTSGDYGQAESDQYRTTEQYAWLRHIYGNFTEDGRGTTEDYYGLYGSDDDATTISSALATKHYSKTTRPGEPTLEDYYRWFGIDKTTENYR